MLDHGYSLSEIERRLANLIRLGTIKEADYAKARVRVQIGEAITTWLPWLTMRASHDITWWAPEVGEQVVVLAPFGELGQGVVLAAIYQQKHAAPLQDAAKSTIRYKDGTTLTYDREAHTLQVNVHSEGSLTLQCGGSSIVMDQQSIRLISSRIDLN